ncbi:MAG: TIGR03960 family B12-binding radical SAM protein [Chloroflexota bacterium]
MTNARDIDRILPLVSKPARYVGNEWNSIHKDHDRVDVKVAFAFPDVYEVGMSHLGSKILYHEINRRADAVCERVFAPWIDMEALMRERGLPLFALESRRPVREFDIFAFTLQYEMTFTNILNMIDLAGLPLRSEARGPHQPLVIAGGPCAFNPEPLAPFIDAFAIGEGEEVIHDIIAAVKEAKRDGSGQADRDLLLLRLAAIEGVYVPRFYDVDYHAGGTVAAVRPNRPDVPAVVTKRIVRDLDAVDYPTEPIVPYMDIVHDRAMVEIFRGCTRGCRFCQAGQLYRPVRERSPEKVLELADRLVKATGHDELSLTSLASGDYTAIEPVLRQLLDRHGRERVSVSLPSLRVDAFSVALADLTQEVRRTGLTLAPEAGTQRLRDVINKNVTEADLVAATEAAFSRGWDTLKFYFMIGLPTETDADLDGIADLCGVVEGAYRRVTAGRKARPLRITVSTASFVPKSNTPFQWFGQVPVPELRRRQQYLGQRLKRRRVNYNWHDANLSFIEAVFARGDRRVADALEVAWRRGCRFDGWSEQFNFPVWLEAFTVTGVDPAFYANRDRSPGEVFPWQHVSPGVSRDYLYGEYERALSGVTTGDCRVGNCTLCEVCPTLSAHVITRDWAEGGQR